MSDAYSDTSQQPTQDSETIRCRICNRLPPNVQVTVHPWKGQPIQVASNTGQMFTLLPGTNIRVQRAGNTINVRLFGDATNTKYVLEKNVELALVTDLAIDLVAEDLAQVTLIQPVHPSLSGEVKCGEG